MARYIDNLDSPIETTILGKPVYLTYSNFTKDFTCSWEFSIRDDLNKDITDCVKYLMPDYFEMIRLSCADKAMIAWLKKDLLDE